jgi:uncharacterized protein YuzE
LEDGETVHNALSSNFDRSFKEEMQMEIKYFPDTDSLSINFTDKGIVETRDLNENTLIELDQDGYLVSMTIEHAQQQANINDFSYHQVVKQAKVA